MLRFEALPHFATCLSYRRRAVAAQRGVFSALARLSLGGVVVSMSTACLIEDPPPYTQPAQTPPRLDLVATLPHPRQVIVRNTGDPIDFRIPVASEDAGDRLEAVLQIDMGTPNEDDYVTSVPVPPSTLDDTSRVISLTYTVREADLTPGCHHFTIRVSHQSNFTTGPNVENPKDLAEAYWVANIDPPPGSTTLDCPRASTGGM